MGNKGTPKETK